MAELFSIIAVGACLIAFFSLIVWSITRGMRHDRASGSIVASSMLEMDRFIRPSTGHIVEAQEEMKRHEDGTGGE